jgi:hypothetical protein
MTATGTVRSAVPAFGQPPRLLDGRRWLIVALALFGGLMLLMLLTAETGPGELRNTAPVPIGTTVYHYNGGVRANAPVLGWTGWVYLWQVIGFGGGAAILGTYGVKSWKARRMHPLLCLSFAAGGMFAFDPFYNWLGYFPTNPAFLHVPHGALPWSDLAPTFEPVFFLPLYIVWLIVPALIAHGLWTKLKARGFAKRGPQAFMTAHPLLALIIVCKCVTFPLDLGGFRLGCLTEAFIFTQAPGPLWAGGTTGQAQFLWEPLLFELTMMAATLLMYRDRNGDTIQERWGRRMVTSARLPRLSEFTAAFTLLAISYVVCLGGMGALRFTGQDDKLANPWPYTDTLVYDPDGLYQKAGVPADQTRPGDANWTGVRPR